MSQGDRVIRSPYNAVHLPQNVSFPDFVMQKISAYGEKVALIDEARRRQLTFVDIIHQVAALRRGLYGAGIRQGDVVCLCTPNIIEYPVITLAVMSLGAVLSPANPNYTAGELKKQLETANAKFIITSNVLLKKTASACEHFPVKKIFPLDKVPGHTSVQELLNTVKELPSVVPAVNIDCRNDVAVLPFSSGTTGFAKGVELTHFNLVANISQSSMRDFHYYSLEDVFVTYLPFFHVYGLMVVMFLGLYLGVTNVVMAKFDPHKYLQAIQEYKATVLNLVPPTALFLTQSELVRCHDLTSVRTIWCGAAPVTRILLDQLRSIISGVSIRQGYGMSEASPMVISSPPMNNKLESVGVPLPNTTVKVVDLTTRKSLGPHQEGEILIRGPQIMKSYANNPQATAESVKDGWLCSGDVGYYDNDGYLYITDRIKEMIKYKGYQVAPIELETILLQHVDVIDCAVIGLPNQRAGELPTGCIVRRKNATTSAEQLCEFVARQVAPHKALHGGVIFVKEVPKSPTGKILRRVLKQRYSSKL